MDEPKFGVEPALAPNSLLQRVLDPPLPLALLLALELARVRPLPLDVVLPPPDNHLVGVRPRWRGRHRWREERSRRGKVRAQVLKQRAGRHVRRQLLRQKLLGLSNIPPADDPSAFKKGNVGEGEERRN